MTTISLCAIVKNEEEMLPKCLESVQGFVDEIVIVDTGSTDNTIEIAKRYGARVEYFEWINDFSAARNFALKHCKTDYALVLDADEVLYTSDFSNKEEFLVYIEQLDSNLGLVSLHQALSVQSEYDSIIDGSARAGTPVLLPRIVPITEDVEYKGLIHEAPVSLTESHMLFVTPIQIIHLGADPKWRRSRNKNDRNLALLMEAMKDSEDITQYYSYLASELSVAGKQEEAFKMIEKGWEEYKKTPVEKRQIGNSLVLTIYPTLLFLNNRQKEGFEALAFIFSQDTKDNLFSIDPNVLYMTSRLLIDVHVSENFKIELFETLEGMTEALIESRDVPFLTEQMKGIMDYKSKEMLALIRIKLGKLIPAMKIIEELIAEYPDNTNYTLLKAECLLSSGAVEDVVESINILYPLIQQNTSINDAYALATAASVIMHDVTKEEFYWNSAIDFWTHAVNNSFNGFNAIHRSRFLSGFAIMKSMLEGKPKPGPGAYGVMGALMTRQPNQTYTTVPKFVIRKSVYRMLELNHLQYIEPLLEPKAEETLFGINSYVREILEEIGVEIYDDEQPTPIFIGGQGCKILVDILEGFPQLHVESNFGYHNHMIQGVIDYHEAKQLEKDPFEDAFSWLNDDQGVEDDDVYESLQHGLVHLFSKATDDDNSLRFVDISEQNTEIYNNLTNVFPKGRIIHFIEDPREFVLQKVEEHTGEVTDDDLEKFCTMWERNIINFRSFFQDHEEVYLETTLQLWIHNAQQQYTRMLCFLDLLKNEDIDLPEIEDSQRWKYDLDIEHVTFVENKLHAIITFLGFNLTVDSVIEDQDKEEA